ncbi:unnamed protein product [Adineta ricciae]|uniref:Uncharacterized protein n=1 Tax=Adineta ricciae TaxID=249248 RepID=A0A814B3Y5_ADIRI|nr:unnamed protein product [Adineta ricciae]
MRHEGYNESDEDLIDDVSDPFVLCALHQAKIIRERWKFWSGSVPANVSIRLHRLESLLSVKNNVCQSRSVSEMIQSDKQTIKASSKPYKKEIPLNTSAIPAQLTSKLNSSQPFIAEIRTYPIKDKLEPKQNIVIQGPNTRRIVFEKRRIHFWCCH